MCLRSQFLLELDQSAVRAQLQLGHQLHWNQGQPGRVRVHPQQLLGLDSRILHFQLLKHAPRSLQLGVQDMRAKLLEHQKHQRDCL